MRALLLSLLLVIAGCGGGPAPRPPPQTVLDAREMHRQALDAHAAGRYRAALAMFEEAEKSFRSIDDAHGIASAAISQAEIRLLYGEAPEAREALRRAQAAIDRHGNVLLQPRARLVEARLLAAQDVAAAREQLRELASLPGRTGALAALVECELALQSGEDCMQRPVEGGPLIEARLRQVQAGASLRAGRNEEGLRRLETALSLYRGEGYRPGIASVHEALGEVRLELGERDEARWHFERALYLRLWINDAVHARAVLEKLEPLASDADMAARYAAWREALADDAKEPQWDQLMSELLTPL